MIPEEWDKIPSKLTPSNMFAQGEDQPFLHFRLSRKSNRAIACLLVLRSRIVVHPQNSAVGAAEAGVPAGSLVRPDIPKHGATQNEQNDG